MNPVRLARSTRPGSGNQMGSGPFATLRVTTFLSRSPTSPLPCFPASPPSRRRRIELRVLRVEPRLVVVRILERECGFGHLERAERVHHDGQLFGVFGPDARLGPAGMRAMGNAVRVVRDAPELNPLPAHEFARGVVEHFVRIDVAVVVWSRHRLRVEVVGPGAEAAHHEPVALKRLVDRRRLVHPSHDGLEVHDVERPGIEVPVPTYHVEWMMIENDLMEPIVLPPQNAEGSPLIVGAELCRPADIALAVRSALDQLAKLVAVAL